MSVADLPDPRTWPVLSSDAFDAIPGSASSRAAELHRVVINALESTTSRDEALLNGEAVGMIATWMSQDAGELGGASAAPPSVTVPRHLWRLLAGMGRGAEKETDTLHTPLFATPIILGAALDRASPPVALPGAI